MKPPRVQAPDIIWAYAIPLPACQLVPAGSRRAVLTLGAKSLAQSHKLILMVFKLLKLKLMLFKLLFEADS